MSNAIKKSTENKIKIDGGYILLSRKIIESEIFQKPPLYLKVWVYILSRAQHQEYKQLNRGELWLTIPEIQKDCSWYVGFRKETPSKHQIYRILEWLRFPYEHGNERDTNEQMITTTRATRGLLIKVLNYSVYQEPRNYERNNERNNEKNTNELRPQQHRNTINKNDKNDKNDKNKEYIVDYLNSVCGTSFKSTSKSTQSHINARLDEGFTVDDFKSVIDKKFDEWGSDEKMSKFLRPQTLFGTKFESYLNQKSVAKYVEHVPGYMTRSKPQSDNHEEVESKEELRKELLEKIKSKT